MDEKTYFFVRVVSPGSISVPVQGLVVQGIVSLMRPLLKDSLCLQVHVKPSMQFCGKNERSFCCTKTCHIFQQKMTVFLGTVCLKI